MDRLQKSSKVMNHLNFIGTVGLIIGTVVIHWNFALTGSEWFIYFSYCQGQMQPLLWRGGGIYLNIVTFNNHVKNTLSTIIKIQFNKSNRIRAGNNI